jgi:cytochrome P450
MMRAARTVHLTFLSRLALEQATKPKSLTDCGIITQAFGNISAGSDTTAIAIRSVLYYHLKSPGVCAREREEIRTNLVLPVSVAKANALVHLRAVIHEAMRLRVSVGQLLGHTAPSEGTITRGYHMGPKAEVGMSPWVLQ